MAELQDNSQHVNCFRRLTFPEKLRQKLRR